jgi:integrase
MSPQAKVLRVMLQEHAEHSWPVAADTATCDDPREGDRFTQGSLLGEQAGAVPLRVLTGQVPDYYIYLSHGQVLALASEAGRGRLLILLLAYTGLRWGEATALRVCDIDFDRRRVDVRRAFSDVGGRVILGTPKSHQSRTVPLPRFLATEIAAAVAGRHADQLVFTMPGGGVMRLTNWRRSVFLSARRRAGLSDRFRVHDLRHTAASLMIQAGYPPKMLQEIMGHASITTTLDLYGHLYPGEMDRYADRLNEAAGMTDAAKMRPDDTGDEADPEGSTR